MDKVFKKFAHLLKSNTEYSKKYLLTNMFKHSINDCLAIVEAEHVDLWKMRLEFLTRNLANWATSDGKGANFCFYTTS